MRPPRRARLVAGASDETPPAGGALCRVGRGAVDATRVAVFTLATSLAYLARPDVAAALAKMTDFLCEDIGYEPWIVQKLQILEESNFARRCFAL